jgi:hypothetical protein
MVNQHIDEYHPPLAYPQGILTFHVSTKIRTDR